MADNVDVLRTSMDPVLYRYARAANGHFLREHIKKLETERKDIVEKRIKEERKRIQELTEERILHRTRKVSKESDEIRKHMEELEEERENAHILHRKLTPNGNTILHVAVQFGHVENVKVVLEERPHLVLHGNKKGETPLHMAARDGLADIVKELILGAQRLEGGDLDVKKMLKLATNDDKDTALHMAARNCHLKEDEYLKVVKLLLKKAKEDEYWDLDFQHPHNNVGETPLYLAVERGKMGQEIVLELLKTCNSQDHYSGPGGRTALHAVAFHYKDSQDRSTVRELLTRMKELIDIPDNDANIPNKICWTPLQYAACSGNVLVMEELLSLNPDCWEMVDTKGQNILHIAVDKNMKSAIDYIRNQDWFRHLINQKDDDGNTPLHLLVESDYRVDELWNHDKADKHVFNGANMTPVDLVWSNTIKKTGLRTFAAAYIEDETFLGSEIDGGRIIAFKEHENLAKFKRFKEEGKIKEQNKKKEKDEKDETRKKKQIEARKASMTVYESLVIVAALIATISSAAAFAIPGGYDGNQGRDQGMAVLARTTAFKAFVITNTIALASSVTSILLCLNALYYYSISNGESEKITQRYAVAGVLILLSIFFLMLAFITAAFAVLAHSIAFAVSTCIIVCIGFIILFFESLEIFLYQSRMAKDKNNASAVQGATNNGNRATHLAQGAPNNGNGATHLAQGATNNGNGAMHLAQGAPNNGNGATHLAQGATNNGNGATHLAQGANNNGNGATHLAQGATNNGNGATHLDQGANNNGNGVTHLAQGATNNGNGATHLAQGVSNNGNGAMDLV